MCIKTGGRIGDYQITRTIVSTGNACLYQAVEWVEGHKEKLPYVLKELKRSISESVTLQKEKDITHYIEIQSKKSILIPVLKVIRNGKKEYAVMQLYHHGQILSECIDELEGKYGKGRIPLFIQLHILYTILESLQELHTCIRGEESRGYLHLDLHPGNIFLENSNVVQGKFGTAKFLDFQNALKMDADGRALGDLTVMGVTPGFSAPELYVFGGEQKRQVYTEGADLYTVSAIGARMLTGRWITDSFHTYLELLEKENWEERGENFLTSQFIELLKLGLGTNPKYRFQNALAMKRSVNALLERLQELHSCRYYQLFSSAYKMHIPHQQIWARGMTYHSAEFHRAVELLREEMNRQDHDTARSHYLFCALWKMKDAFGKQIPDDDVYELTLCGIESYNYLGDSNHAADLFDRLQKVQGEMPLMEYLKLINNAAEFYIDTFRYEAALSLMRKNKNAFDQIRQVYFDVAGNHGLNPVSASRMSERAKTYMNYGRYLTFLHREGGLEYLKEALEEFDEKEDNRQITLSHILHYAVEMREKELFEAYAEMYLGCCFTEKNAYETLQILMEQGALWRLWIFLKSIYYFYMPLFQPQEKRQFFDLLCVLAEGDQLPQSGAYPIEHIYKYIALILWEGAETCAKWKEAADKAFSAAMTCPGKEQIDPDCPLTIRMLMKYQIAAIYLEKTGKKKACDELRDILLEHSGRSGWDTLTEVLKQGCPVSELLGYEHC